jgi:GntR family transcriptional regulator / MocR family aminotransferase
MDIRGLTLNRSLDTPVYRQLYWRFRDAIATGKLAPGARVPSVRSLASELNLARGTVELAYQILVSEGYLVTQGPAGTMVSPELGGIRRRRLPGTATDTRQPAPSAAHEPLPFQMGLPALDAFPRKTWIRLAGRRLRATSSLDLSYPEVGGHAPLRRAISTYLGISRGIACSPDQVFVTAGYGGALDLIAHTLLRPGDTGWFEDPGYPHARRLLEQLGMNLIPVPVDDEGLDVESGLRLEPEARFAVVTPTHQSPLGVALSLSRRLALLDWARSQKAWIIEDDYDSEFRYHGKPLPALKSLDRNDRVLYTGTFSKVLYPGLRLAYLVVPESKIRTFRQATQLLGSGGPGQLQSIVADFIEQGYFARHLTKMRTLYAMRRGFLVDALQEAFGSELQIPARVGGIHVLTYWASKRNDKALAEAALSAGLSVQALSAWSLRPRARAGMMLGFTNLASADQARMQVQRLCQAFGLPHDSNCSSR